MDSERFLSTVEFYSPVKKDEILGKWMNLANIILTEVNQTQKDKKQANKQKTPHVLSICRLQPDIYIYEFMYEYVCASVQVNVGRA